MIGHRLSVDSDRFDYVIGVLVDEGLLGDVDFAPVGAAEIVVTEDAWDRLDGEAQQEIARFVRSPALVRVNGVGDAQPAGDTGSGRGRSRGASSGPATSTKSTKGAR